MACSYMWVYTVCLALCIHLMNAMRTELVNSNDGLFCECKTAKSESECYWGNFYHAEVKKCCRMSKKKGTLGKVFHKASFWKDKSYVRQNTEELCLEETRPFNGGACCTVARSAEFFGESIKIQLSYAKAYSMGHPKMNSLPKEMKLEDYRNKSNIVIEMDAVSSGTVNYFGNRLPVDKIKEGLERLQQKDQLLECEEKVGEVEQGGCQVRKQPICCCKQGILDAPVKQEVGAPRCMSLKCAPKTDEVSLKGNLEWRKFGGYAMTEKVDWDRFAPFEECPDSFLWKGLTFVKKDLREQLTGDKYGKCEKTQTTTYLDDSTVPPHKRKRTWCIKKSYSKRCKAGKVLYAFFRGHTLKDALLCPSDYKSNLPGDRFDSRCNCGDVENVQDSLSRRDHGNGEVRGGVWKPLEWI